MDVIALAEYLQLSPKIVERLVLLIPEKKITDDDLKKAASQILRKEYLKKIV